MKINIEHSNRHIHPSPELIEKLFGPEYTLNSIKKLSQGENFAAAETVTLIGKKGNLENVRVIGPAREKTQIEISKTDSFKLGIDVPIRLSGNLENSANIKITAPLGEVELAEGLIIAQRHLHMSPEDAKKEKLKEGQIIKIKIDGERALIFDKVIVRIREDFKTMLHLDTDESNAAGLKQNDKGIII
ncbi:phosphate propanoyltransferase [bacterium]|nr:phosphate propanoyltransferase [bacterium]